MKKEDLNIKVPTTSDHFNLFKLEAEKWIKFFGLSDWQVHFAHKDTGRRAYMFADLCAKIATIGLCVEWEEYTEDALSDHNIKRSAFHEVCELLLVKLTGIAADRFGWCKQDLEEATHCVIRRMENSIFNQGGRQNAKV